MNIRRAEKTDARGIAEFNVRLAVETEDLRLDPDRVLAGVTALLSDRSKGVYYVAVEGGELAGQLMITYEWSDWRNALIWWIQSVYVAQPFRGQGVFRALFAHVERLAREQGGVCCLRLYMHRENASARRTYERLGMKPTHYEVFEKEFQH